MGDTMDGSFERWFTAITNRLKKDGKVEAMSSEFGKLHSDEARVAFVLDIPSVDEVIKIKQSSAVKSAEQSVKLRNEGNQFFQKKNLEKALETYTLSVLHAPVNKQGTSSELALAFANRSAVLYHMSKYNLCIQDIELAFQYGYSDEMKYKLYDRKGKCLLQLAQYDKAKDAFYEATQYLKQGKLDAKKRENVSDDLALQMQKCQIQNESITPENENTQSAVIDTVTTGVTFGEDGPSDKYPAASSILDVKSTPEQGRFPFATKDLEAGEVVVIEKPYASVLLPEHTKTHCHHCFKRIIAPVPCTQCYNVRYCTSECQSQSWESYHKIECGTLDLVQNAGIGGMGHLALRVVVKAGHLFLTDFKNSIKSDVPENLQGFNADGVYDPKEYSPIYYLVTHSEDRSVSDLFRRTVMAIFLLKCLQQSSFFSLNEIHEIESGTGDQYLKDSSHAYIGGLLLRHLQNLPCNAHEVSELVLNPKSVESSATIEIGAAIYATMSLFNHSCDPAVTRNFYGDTCVVRTIRRVAVGEEIADNYGALSPVSPRHERQAKLKEQYYFTCGCNACVNDWPMYTDINANVPIFKCDGCGVALNSASKECVPNEVECKQCKKKQQFTERLKKLRSSEDAYLEALTTFLQDSDATKALPKLLSHLQLMDALVCRPWRDHNNCQEAIKQCYNMMGNCYKTEK